jgi:hypothetical protein
VAPPDGNDSNRKTGGGGGQFVKISGTSGSDTLAYFDGLAAIKAVLPHRYLGRRGAILAADATANAELL